MSFDPLALVRPGVRALRPLAPGRPRADVGPAADNAPTVLLMANENALAPSSRALEALAAVGAKANRYPDEGSHALRLRLAREHGLPPGMFAVGAGASELLELLVELFVGAGDEVVVAHPSFVLYGLFVGRQDGVLVAVPGRGLAHDLDAMLAAIGPRTRLVIVCNPNNPTGTMVDAAAWSGFLARVPPGVVVVSDEAYHEYVDDPGYPRTIDDLAGERPLVILRTFSKLHALAGLRVGYAIARPELIALFDRVRVPYNVSAPAQAAAVAALDDVAYAERARELVRAGRAQLSAALPGLGVVAHPSATNFILAELDRDARPVCAALETRGVFVREMTGWGMEPRFFRITIGTADENRALLAALATVLGGSTAGVA